MTQPTGTDTLVLVVRQLVTDDAGAPVLNDRRQRQYEDVRTTKSGCAFEIASTSESVSNTDVSKARARAFLPWDSDTIALTERDAIEYLGRSYEMEGPPHPWTDYDGNPDHVQVTLEWNGG